jgi:type VI secretion system protein ImpK
MSEPLQGVEPDEDATVFLPTPGRARVQQAPAIERATAAADLAKLGGLNPLVEAANHLLAAVPQIRHALRHPDPAGLRAQLRAEIASFERNARAANVAEDRVSVARYALCALLDDSAAATPWGRDWGTGGLLAEIHNEASGAEKFFTQLEQMSADGEKTEKNADVLEFFYVCLALGFEGKHRGSDGGRQALAQTREKLNALLQPLRPPIPMELSARWKGAALPARRVPGALALWAAASACVLVLGGIYLAYVLSLGALSDPVARQLAQLNAAPPAAQAVPAAAAPKPKPAAHSDP